jgi:hypothetical protein
MNIQCAPNPPPPPNDDPANATPIPSSTVCNFVNGTNVFATATAGVAAPAGCGGACAVSTGSYSGLDVWYSTTVAASGNLSIQTQLVSSPNISMAVYGGTPGALTPITSCPTAPYCNDDSSPGVFNPFLTFSGLTPGATVYIRVWSNSGLPNMGTFRICAYEPIPPPNDNPCGSINLPVGAACSPTSATTENATPLAASITATPAVPMGGCGTPSGDVWFTAVMPSGTTSLILNTTAGSLTNMSMAVYTLASGSICGTATLTQVGNCSSVNGASLMPRLVVPDGTVPDGTLLYIRMWSDVAGTFGTFSICAFENYPPPNDNPCGAIALPVTNGCLFPAPYTTENATATAVPAAPGCGGATVDDVWFTAVVPASGQLQIDTDEGQLTDAAIAVYSGTCGALTLIGGSCQVAGSTNGPLMPISNITQPADSTVYIRIWRSSGNSGTFLICASNPVPPAGCYYTLRMQDSGGDGWNGGFVTLCVGGSCTNYTVYGTQSTIIFPATNGQLVTVAYTPAGGFQNQVSFQVLAQNGFLLFGSASPPLTGVNYGFTVNGATCNVPPSPPSDCLGAFEVCNNQTFSQNPTNTGNAVDLTATNDGCLAGEQQGVWFRFTTNAAGNIAFTIQVAAGTDYDFAVWGPYSTPTPTCPPNQPPLRCSWSGLTGNTGLDYVALDVSENAGGDKWVQYIPSAANQTYILYVDNWSRNGISFSMVWNNQPSNILDCILPLELLSFNATPKPRQVDLKWVTTNETNTSYFNVERSLDGNRFDLLGTVAAAGNSAGVLEYTFVDAAPVKGINYYRLDQADVTGERSYSNVVTAVYKWEHVRMDVYPNPTNGNVWMSVEMSHEGNTQWRVTDASGRLVRTGRSGVVVGMNQVEIDLDGLDQGSYVLELMDETGAPLSTARFVRQ